MSVTDEPNERPEKSPFEVRQDQVEKSSDSFKQNMKKLLALLEGDNDLLLRADLVATLQRRMLLIQQVLNQMN